MAVRAKMRCTHRQEYTEGGHSDKLSGVNVTLQPVYASGPDDKANTEWSKWTPSGQLQMTITNPAAYEQFQLGKAYYVDLTPADD
ncbi:MAG: hypothetical protein AAB721_02820 [Patescibacteria group bacterium]